MFQQPHPPWRQMSEAWGHPVLNSSLNGNENIFWFGSEWLELTCSHPFTTGLGVLWMDSLPHMVYISSRWYGKYDCPGGFEMTWEFQVLQAPFLKCTVLAKPGFATTSLASSLLLCFFPFATWGQPWTHLCHWAMPWVMAVHPLLPISL